MLDKLSKSNKDAGPSWAMSFLDAAQHRPPLFTLADDPNATNEDISALLTPKLDLEIKDISGKTALLRAAWAQNTQMVKALAEKNADVHATDKSGKTALHLAAASPERNTLYTMVPVMSVLLTAGADVNAQDARGQTPLFNTQSRGAARRLLDAGADIQHRDAKGDTALTSAAQAWKPRVMLELLKRGADPLATNAAGQCCLDLIRQHYELDDDHVLPSSPNELAIQLDKFDLSPPKRIAPRVPAAVITEAPKKRINGLPSGGKIPLSHRPQARLDSLSPQDEDSLSKALGFGPLNQESKKLSNAQKAAVWETLDDFNHDIAYQFMNHDNSVLNKEGVLSALTAAEDMELRVHMRTAHMYVASVPDKKPFADAPASEQEPAANRIKVFFFGNQAWKDGLHDAVSVLGGTSHVDRAVRRIGELLAKQISSPKNTLQIDRIAGASMGGVSAQTLLAALQSRVALPEQPSLLLLDPQLLNNRQADRAIRKGEDKGELAVDYSAPRGVAISLDYDKAPRRGLMGVMKGLGRFKSPGLVHLKLGLADTDGAGGTKPKPFPVPGLGYHADLNQFNNALKRFLSAPNIDPDSK